jgi:hypothetical protein
MVVCLALARFLSGRMEMERENEMPIISARTAAPLWPALNSFPLGTRYVYARGLWKKRHGMMDINEVERALIMQQTCFRNFIAALALHA